MPSTTTAPARLARRTRSGALGCIAGAGLLLALSGCAPAATPELESGSYERSVQDWRMKIDGCMLAAGFDLRAAGDTGEPSASIDLSQFDMVAFDAAYAGCIDDIGDAPIDESLPSEEELFESQLIFAKCMREAGYDYPDPVKGSGGMGPAFGPETDPDVVEACSAVAYDEAGSK
ncbi:MAG: hypothetical protein GX871_01640 [Microbacteriaceae bacterium]|jgi:hypothetical protein|nr:hypothetical protein [Microbacteriaceae bacterium]